MNILKSIATRGIKFLLYILDSNHRKNNEITNDNKKFTHLHHIKFNSDFGQASKVMRTVPYDAWIIKTETKELICADKHIIIDSGHQTVYAMDLKVGDFISTETGPEEVIEVRSMGIKVHMYDMEVNTYDFSDPYNHLYYSNGILSHNTTCASSFILWFTTFFSDKTVLICANKMNQAQEIMDRIKFSYENMEDNNWLRPGVVEYNKGNISFDNGSSIVCRATTKDSGRGLSISLLYIDEFAFVLPRIAEEFWTAISPVLSTGGNSIITSTPNSDEDRFAKIWNGANIHIDEFGNEIPDGLGVNGYYPMMFPYYHFPGRDEKWALSEKQKLGEAKFLQEHACVSGDTSITIKMNGNIIDLTIDQLVAMMEISNDKE